MAEIDNESRRRGREEKKEGVGLKLMQVVEEAGRKVGRARSNDASAWNLEIGGAGGKRRLFS